MSELYIVVGADGVDYGPVEIGTLKLWASDGRVTPITELREYITQKTMRAGDLPELFGGLRAADLAVLGLSPEERAAKSEAESKKAFQYIIFSSIVSVCIFFLFKGSGLILSGFNLIPAWQNRKSANGPLGLIVAIVVFIFILVGLILRVKTYR